MATNPQEEAKKAKKELQGINEIVGALDDGFQSLTSRLTDVVDELKDASGEATLFSRIQKDTLSSLNSISRANEKLIKNQIELNSGSLSSKKITEQIQSLAATREILQQRLNNLLTKQTDGLKLTENELKEINKLQNGIAETTQEVADNYTKQLNAAQKIENKLGNTGKLLKGISKIPVLGNLIDAEEALAAAQNEASKETSTRASVMKKSFESLGSSLKTSLTDPLTQIALLVKAFQTLYKIGVGFSKDQADISRTLGVSSDRAGEMANNMREMARNSNDLFANAKDNLTAFKELNDTFGTSVEFNQKQLATQTKLKEAAGLTADEAAKLAEYEQLTGKSSEDVYNNIGKTNKGVLSQKKITQEVLKVSGQLAAQYKNNPDLIAKAVTQAQKLGMTLEQTKNISKGLLNFEDSISAELEAELLTGQDLNLEKARALALAGDTAGAAAELMKNLGPNGLQRFQKMNVLQQESYAKALGMSADELGDSLRKQEALSNLEKGRGKGITEQIKKLQEEGRVEEAAELQKRVTQGETVELAMQRLDAEAELTKNIEKTKDSLKSMIAGPLGTIASMASSLVGMLNKIPGMGAILGIIGAGAAIGVLIAGVAVLVKTIKGLFGKGPADQTAKNTKRTADAVEKIANSGGSIDGTGSSSGKRGKKGKSKKGRSRRGRKGKKGLGIAGAAAFSMMEAADTDAISDMADGGGIDAASELASTSTPSSSPKPSTPKPSTPKSSIPKSSALNAASKSKGMFGKVGSFFGGIGKKISGSFGGLKKILGGPIAKGFGKALGPILTIIEGVSSAYSLISEAKEKQAAGEKVDSGALGKSLVQSAAYPIANLGLNLIPGVGTALSIADGIAGSFGLSPIQWATDNLVDLIPTDAFSGLGNLALGGKEKAMATGGIVTGPTRALVGEAGPEAVIPLNQLMNEFKEMKQILTAILHKEGTITLNGTKMGTAMAVGSYKVQ